MNVRRHPQKRSATIPVTSRQLKFYRLTFPRIRFNASWTFAALIPPKNITFTSSAWKKKFQTAARIFLSWAKPSRTLITLQFPKCGSLSKGNILAYSLICLAIRSSLVCVLTESALLGRLLGAGVCSLVQLIGLAL